MQIRNYKTYVKREIVHQSSLRHPSIIRLREVGGRWLCDRSSCLQDETRPSIGL